jgi:hypothetical protein
MLERKGQFANGEFRMRNLAMSADASFERAVMRWTKNDLPISLQWRSTMWRHVVPTLWVLGWAFWIWVLSVDTPGRSMIFYALLFVGIPLILAATAAWWVGQLLHRRHAGMLVVNDDYLEWQFEMGSTVELLADCGRFEFAGKRDYDARIEWDVATPGEAPSGGWPQWTRRWRALDWLKSDRTLYGRDVGLDRGDLDSLCKLLNQLREEAKAQR